MRSTAWRRICASPGAKPSRPRSSGGFRPGRTGSFRGLMRSARMARSSATGAASGPVSTENAYNAYNDGRLRMAIDNREHIPNNVELGENRALKRAREQWQPHFLDWWKEMGPLGFADADVYLRTATTVDAQGWASYGMV